MKSTVTVLLLSALIALTTTSIAQSPSPSKKMEKATQNVQNITQAGAVQTTSTVKTSTGTATGVVISKPTPILLDKTVVPPPAKSKPSASPSK